MRLIDADALIAEWYKLNNIGPEDCGARFVGYQEIARLINNAPTVSGQGDYISRADAMGAVQDHFNANGFKGYDDGQKMMDRINAIPSAENPKADEQKIQSGDLISRNALMEYCSNQKSKTIDNNDIARFPSADAEQVTSKLKKPCDSLLTDDSAECKEQKSKLESADAVHGWRVGKPKEQGEYMVTLDSFGHKHIDLFYYGKPMMPNRKVRGKCWYRSDDEWGDVVYDDTDILAWMPLPTPYKGGDDE